MGCTFVGQEQLANEESQLSLYRNLTQLRQGQVFQKGELKLGNHSDDSLLYFTRLDPTGKGYLIILNLGAGEARFKNEWMAVNGTVVLHTGQFSTGAQLSTRNLKLYPAQGVIMNISLRDIESG